MLTFSNSKYLIPYGGKGTGVATQFQNGVDRFLQASIFSSQPSLYSTGTFSLTAATPLTFDSGNGDDVLQMTNFSITKTSSFLNYATVLNDMLALKIQNVTLSMTQNQVASQTLDLSCTNSSYFGVSYDITMIDNTPLPSWIAVTYSTYTVTLDITAPDLISTEIYQIKLAHMVDFDPLTYYSIFNLTINFVAPPCFVSG